MTRFREDDRFKAVSPESIVLSFSGHGGFPNGPVALAVEREPQAEIWFDWAFVDFWKSNYCEHPVGI
jgi:hypothetical protein